jgi:hypothetical protein
MSGSGYRRSRDELTTVASRVTSRYINRGVDVYPIIDMNVSTQRESKSVAPHEGSGRKPDRKACEVISPLQQVHGRTSAPARPTPPVVRFVGRSRPRPNAAFLAFYSVKLLVEAVPPRSLKRRVICSMQLLVEAVPPRSLKCRVICPVTLLVEAVPPRSLSSRVQNRMNSSTAARLSSRWPRLLYLGLVGSDQQIPNTEVPARDVQQIRLFNLLGTAVQPE